MTEPPAQYRTRRRTDPPPPVATMTLVEITERQKILAGHDTDTESVWVLRKDSGGDYQLFRIPIPELDQALRSFTDTDSMELVAAITATMAKPKKRRTRKVKR